MPTNQSSLFAAATRTPTRELMKTDFITNKFNLLYLEEDEDVVSTIDRASIESSKENNVIIDSNSIVRIWITTQAVFFEEEEEELSIDFGQKKGVADGLGIEKRVKKIVKIRYADEMAIERTSEEVVRITSVRVIVIKGNVPRVNVRDRSIVFRVTFKSGEERERFEVPCVKLLNISRQPRQTRNEQIAFLSKQREGNYRFDEGNLRRVSEMNAFDAPAAKITPLVRRAGRVRVSDSFLYFQPLVDINSRRSKSSINSETNNVVRNPAYWIELKSVVAVARRKYASRPCALEVFYEADNNRKNKKNRNGKKDLMMMNGSSVLFAFRSESAREAARDALLKSVNENNDDDDEDYLDKQRRVISSFLDPRNVENALKVTHAWKVGDVSNFEYLMYLNTLSGRSFHDVAQYFVMPWVLKQYDDSAIDLTDSSNYRDLSKPIGALNPSRLKYFLERMKQMREMHKLQQQSQQQKPFLYGTHYSACGYVLFYLLRCAPKHNLKLQNGSFDKPDRLFKSIKETWDSCLENNADLKELIPEFFVPECSRKFLRNGLRLDLGTRTSSKEKIDDVVLPAWARNDPVRFTSINRKALESEYASGNINDWIDLIFGVYQNDAELKMNSFHPLTYDGEINIDDAATIDEQMSLETQINEFGQTPRKLFSKPHEARKVDAWKRWKGQQNKLSSNDDNDSDDNDDNVDDDDDETITPIPSYIRAGVIDTIRLVLRKKDEYDYLLNEGNEEMTTNGIEALKLDESPMRGSSPKLLERSFSDANGDISASLDKDIEKCILGSSNVASAKNVVKKWSTKVHSALVTAVECFAESNAVYSVSSDGFLRVTNIKNGETIRAMPNTSSITCLALLRKSATLLNGRLPVALYGTKESGELFAYSAEYGSIECVSSDNLKNGKSLAPMTAIKVPAFSSSSEQRAVSAHNDGIIALRDIEKKIDIALFGGDSIDKDCANDVLVDPQCNIIISAHDSGIVKAYDSRSSSTKYVWKQNVASRRHIAARSLAFAPLGEGLGDALGFICCVDDVGQCCALETRMRGRIVAAAETTTTGSVCSSSSSSSSSSLMRLNIDAEKNIIVSGLVGRERGENIFRVGKEAGVLRDENDFHDLIVAGDINEGQTSCFCLKPGSESDIVIGSSNGSIGIYSLLC